MQLTSTHATEFQRFLFKKQPKPVTQIAQKEKEL